MRVRGKHSKRYMFGVICLSLVAGILALLFIPASVDIDTTGRVSIILGTYEVLANPGWESPTSDTANGWTDSGLAWDDDTLTAATYSTPAGWGPYLELHIPEIQCTKVQGWWGRVNTQVTTIEVDVYYSGVYNNIYSGAIVTGSFQEYEIGSEQAVTAMRIRFYASKANRLAYVYEASFDVRYRHPDNVKEGYVMPTVEAEGWVFILDSPIVLAPYETGELLVVLEMPEDATSPGDKWEFWVSAKDTTQEGMVMVELATCWLITMK